MAPRGRKVDFGGIKGRIAEALVESIFTRAKYKMARFGRESDLRGILKVGRDEDLAPDFLALKEGLVGREAPGTYHTFMIEVKYRSDLSRYLVLQNRAGKDSVFAKSKVKWPNLCFIFVTDNPEEGRSCFQVLDLGSYQPGEPVETKELHQMGEFQIHPNNVREHEELARKLFGFLSDLEK